MLSLVGSIQPDPFSPEHVPQAPTTTAPSSSQRQRTAAAVPRADPLSALSEREVDAMIEEADADEEDSDADADDPRLGCSWPPRICRMS